MQERVAGQYQTAERDSLTAAKKAKPTVLLSVALVVWFDQMAGAEMHPWPTWQRTSARLGRTDAIGPRSPVVDWSVRVDPSHLDPPLYSFSGLLDTEDRLFVGHSSGLAAIDRRQREIDWQFDDAFSVLSAPSLFEDRILFGSDDDFFYCVDSGTGAEVWKKPAFPHPDRSCAVDEAGVVYYPSQDGAIYARRIADGAEVWTSVLNDIFRSPPTLGDQDLLFIPTNLSREWLIMDRLTGDTFERIELPSDGFGLSIYEDDTLHVASRRFLFSFSTLTWKENWRFDTETINGGVAARRQDGAIYIESGNGEIGTLFAVDVSGKELWRYDFSGQNRGSPGIIDGNGTYFFCTYAADVGYLHAVRADGQASWVFEMPDVVTASPTLAPDGTLYVLCGDKRLYAFEPNCFADLNGSGSVDFADLLMVLTAWGPCQVPANCPQDLDGDGIVAFNDILVILNGWGACSE